MNIKRMTAQIAALVMIGSLSGAALAADGAYGPKGRRFGAGIVAGEPTGITLKGYLTQRMAIDATASWSFVNRGFTVLGDVTFEVANFPISSGTVTLPFYVGAGAVIGINPHKNSNHDTIFGVRVPLGIAVQWVNTPVELYLEAGPGIKLAPETNFQITGGLGVRYYF